MPLVRPTIQAQPSEPSADLADIAAALRAQDPDDRIAAVRAAVRAGRADLLSEAVRETPDPGLREAIFTGLARLGGTDSIRGIVDLLRGEDVGLRNGVIEALQAMGAGVFEEVAPLVRDPDPDVRIFALNILQGVTHGGIEELALAAVETDPAFNVCAAAVEVLAEVGTSVAVPRLQAAEGRFPDHPYFAFAIRMALRRIS